MKWSTYNQSLVRRGEILIGFDVIDNWDRELKQMNKNKVVISKIIGIMQQSRSTISNQGFSRDSNTSF